MANRRLGPIPPPPRSRVAATRRPRVWFLNHYAKAPDRPTGSTRQYAFGRAVVRRGGGATVFAAGYSHLSGTEERVRGLALTRRQTFDGVAFVWIRTIPYGGNDWRRLLNMTSYAVLALLAQIGRPPPDVVVGSTVHPFAALAAWTIARLHGARFIYEVRDLWPQTLIDLGALDAGSPPARALYALEAFLVRRADRVVTVLPGMATYLQERGLPSGHVRYLPNGVDLPGTDAAPGRPASEIARDLGSLLADLDRRRAQGEVTFAYVGNHGRVNRLDVVLRAAALASARTSKPIGLFLVGDGPEKRALQELAVELRLRNVAFVDPMPRDAVHELLAHVDVGIVHVTANPVYRFGVSFNKVFDYMAARRPIVFACDARNDPVAEAGAGLTVRPDDPAALAEAFVTLAHASPETRRAMGDAGRAFAEAQHDMTRLAEAFAEIAGCGPAPGPSLAIEQGRGAVRTVEGRARK